MRRQAILARDVGQARVLPEARLARGSAFGRRFIGDDQALAAGHQADAADDARAGNFVVHSDAGQRRDFEKVRTFVQQQLDALARQQLAALDVALHIFFAAALGGAFQLRAQTIHHGGHGGVVRAVGIGLAVDCGAEFHGNIVAGGWLLVAGHQLLATNYQQLIHRICGEHRQLRREAAVVHFENRFHGEGDFFAAQFGFVRLLRVPGRGGEIRQHFARIHQHHPDVVFP